MEGRRLNYATFGTDNLQFPYFAVGRKNLMFFGSREAGQKPAALFTFVENCRREGIDPFTYLREGFQNPRAITTRNLDDWTPGGLGQEAWVGQGRQAQRLSNLDSIDSKPSLTALHKRERSLL